MAELVLICVSLTLGLLVLINLLISLWEFREDWDVRIMIFLCLFGILLIVFSPFIVERSADKEECKEIKLTIKIR